jgi:hypothetical protein
VRTAPATTAELGPQRRIRADGNADIDLLDQIDLRVLLFLQRSKRAIGDGIDATRVVLRVTDEYGGSRPFANAAVTMTVEGPGEIIGDNPFSLFGGVGAIWIKTKQAAGIVRLNVRHPFLGTKTIEINVRPAPAESVIWPL